MADVAKARDLIERTQKLLAERYNVHLYAFESPVNNLLIQALEALDEADVPATPSTPEPETRVETPRNRRNK